MRPLIIYHAECTDGMGAALAAYLKFGEDADYLAAKHTDNLLELCKDRDVYMLDFSCKRKIIEQIRTQCRLVIIDHHKTAEEDLRGIPGCVFDMNHSGAVLSWMYFHPDKHVPALFQYIEDRDIWKWKLVNSVEISSALQSYGHDFRDARWSSMVGLWDSYFDELVAEGAAINRYRKNMIAVICKTGEHVVLDGHQAVAVNAQYVASELGNFLAHSSPVAIIWFWDGQRKVFNISLRSDGRVDVSAIAAKFGGGGHAASAGFTCQKLPW